MNSRHPILDYATPLGRTRVIPWWLIVASVPVFTLGALMTVGGLIAAFYGSACPALCFYPGVILLISEITVFVRRSIEHATLICAIFFFPVVFSVFGFAISLEESGLSVVTMALFATIIGVSLVIAAHARIGTYWSDLPHA